MHSSFQYKGSEFYMEGVSLTEIAESVGTPFYVYSYEFLRDSFTAYKKAFSEMDTLICYSVKANSNIAVLKAFSDLGAGYDIVSGGELLRVKRAGGDLGKVVFSGVGKTREEMKAAIEAGILFFNVESEEELHVLDDVGKEMGRKAPVALRVNPDINAKTHPYISTGFKKSKFGIEIGRAFEVYKEANKMEGIDVIAIDAHIGSQIFDLTPFVDSVKKLITLADDLVKEGINIQYIDIGGGLGISYKLDDKPPHPSMYADIIMKEFSGKPYKLVLEPGRSLMGNSGMLITKVLYLKEGTEKKFVIVDAAMNDLLRPAFYESYHEILPVVKGSQSKEVVDVVGPICESGDFLAQDRELPKVASGDLLAVLSTGAYGFVMSSNYNTRQRVPEVLVKGDQFSVIRKRETYDELLNLEELPDFL
ncbi:MAG: diaminopimelate decarboxylase [Thermodesulfobacteriota bacterium]|nr:MAG: diaminopimelate decarboxylase [Thermodesulfobacteriota bacterium]